MMEDKLSIWTIFDNRTSDFPGVFVCRRFESFGCPTPHVEPCEIVATGQTLEEVRNKLPLGLHKLHRSKDDDPNIVENWI
jgi:hypothetical protein